MGWDWPSPRNWPAAGATRLVLCGRRPPPDDAMELLARIRQRCPDVRVL